MIDFDNRRPKTDPSSIHHYHHNHNHKVSPLENIRALRSIFINIDCITKLPTYIGNMVFKTSAVASDASPSDYEPLSQEYFQALTNCSLQEDLELLLVFPDFSDALFTSTISPAQVLDYLNAIVTLSPPALSLCSASSSAIHYDSGGDILSSIANSASGAATGTSSSAETIATNTANNLFLNIRNAVAILASEASCRHQISTCGILPKLNNPNNLCAYVEFLQCCILAGQYRYAHRSFVINSLSSFIEVSTSGTNNRNTELFLRYHYLRGVIYYACEDISSAISEWNHCLGTPCVKVSQISVDAWKKMVLAKCLTCQFDDEEEIVLDKKVKTNINSNNARERDTNSPLKRKLVEHVFALPNGVSNNVKRYFSTDGTSVGMVSSAATDREKDARECTVESYHYLVEKFFSNDLEHFSASKLFAQAPASEGLSDYLNVDVNATSTINQMMSNTFHSDGNVGMIKRLIPTMMWRRLRTIGKIYNVIPLVKLSAKLCLSELDCIQFLIQVALRQDADESNIRVPIEFTVDEQAGVIYFDEEGSGGEQKIENNIEKCMALAKRVKDLDIALASSSKYQVNVLKSAVEKGSKSGGRGDGQSVIETL